jgi:hypothetical protein
MRNLWFRIGLGAVAVFAVGMFTLSLGRQVKAQVTSAIRDGGRVAVPLAILPFQVGQDKVGSIRQIDVQRNAGSHAKRINIRVRMKEPGWADQYAQCLFKVDAPAAGGLFACVPEGSAEASDLVEIGEILLRKIVEAWMTTEFSGGRHQRRVNKINAIEDGRDPRDVTNG